MPHCCAVDCTSGTKDKYKVEGVSFHAFPSTKDADKRTLRAKWISNVKRKDWEPTEHSRLCSLHFDSSCFNVTKKQKYEQLGLESPGTGISRRTLCEGSVPTLFSHVPLPKERAFSKARLAKQEKKQASSVPDIGDFSFS